MSASADRPAIGLLDTSVLVAVESGRPLREEGLPQRGATSVVTQAELRAGVLMAPDVQSRDERLATLERLAGMTVLPIDDGVGRTWAGMRAYLAASGRRVGPNDLWIAATAATHRMPVITQDAGFEPLSGVNGLTIVEV
jgi:predicted nucleic acid-binding protein